MELKELNPKTDERGSFTEAFMLPRDGQVSYLLINPGETRGNHYHMHKTEEFLVVMGGAEITVRDRENGTVMRAEVYGDRPIAVKIVPNHTHVIAAKPGGCIIMVWCNEQFDPNNTDTYEEEI